MNPIKFIICENNLGILFMKSSFVKYLMGLNSGRPQRESLSKRKHCQNCEYLEILTKQINAALTFKQLIYNQHYISHCKLNINPGEDSASR